MRVQSKRLYLQKFCQVGAASLTLAGIHFSFHTMQQTQDKKNCDQRNRNGSNFLPKKMTTTHIYFVSFLHSYNYSTNQNFRVACNFQIFFLWLLKPTQGFTDCLMNVGHRKRLKLSVASDIYFTIQLVLWRYRTPITEIKCQLYQIFFACKFQGMTNLNWGLL